MKMSNFYHELDVESVLQCPVCYELPPNSIFLCKTGHHMCDKCRKRLSSCPTCQSALTGSRNFLAEALICKFSVFKGGGDGNIIENNNISSQAGNMPMAGSSISLSENPTPLKSLVLPRGVYNCQLESCQKKKKLWDSGHLIQHVETVHTHLFEKFKNNKCTFMHNFENFCFMKNKKKYHRGFQVSNMGLFFLNITVLEGMFINCWISMAAPVSRTNLFDYEIEFSKEDTDIKIRFVSKMTSSLQGLEWLLQRGKVFIIPPTSHNLDSNQFFSLNIKIVFKSPSAVVQES